MENYDFSRYIYVIGPYYIGPKWRYFSWYGVKRARVVCLWELDREHLKNKSPFGIEGT